MLQAANVGSSSEVVFTLKLAEHPANSGILQKMKAETAKAQEQMYGGGRPGAPGTAAAPNSPTGAVERMRAAAAEEVRMHRTLRTEIERTTAARKVSFDKAVTGANMAAQGVVNLARSYMILGISSEENLEKAVRAFAKFEAVVHAGMGLANIAKGGMGFLGAAGIGISAGTVAGGAALLGGLTAGAAGLAYGFDVAAGGPEERRRQQENGRLSQWQYARARAQEVPFKDPFDSNFRSATRRSFGPSSDRDQMAASDNRIAGLRNLEFEERGQLSMSSKSIYGQDQAVVSAERLVELNRQIGAEYRDRYDTVLRLQQRERETGERSLEVSRRVTQELENRLAMAESRRDAAVSNRDEAGLQYADASARDRSRIQAVAAKIQRGEELTPKERMLARQYGLREQANESARRQNGRENFGGTNLGQLLQGGVDTAQAGVTAASGLVEASREAERIMRDELERRIAARYKQQLIDIVDVIDKSMDKGPGLEEVAKERRAARAATNAAGG